MSKIEIVQKAMIQAMKNHDSERKETLTLLLSALKLRAKDKRADLTEEEEDSIILKEMKQTKEMLDTAPAEREDIIAKAKARLEVLQEFAPARLDETEIQAIIQKILKELELTAPTAKDKGMIMQRLMPLVKGKADGALVNQLVTALWQE